VWGATRLDDKTREIVFVSIHAPRVGSDEKSRFINHLLAVSIHAPRVGSDIEPYFRFEPKESFNPRPPCGERLPLAVHPFTNFWVSIHAPRVGSDTIS